ncbi:hypothetical protein EON67_04365 [archaeon]|nr:MAG: hypothetical protein EON67_04365 [archaeon]
MSRMARKSRSRYGAHHLPMWPARRRVRKKWNHPRPYGVLTVFHVLQIKRSTPMRKVMDAFATRKGVSVDSLRFVFDGVRLTPEQTPEEVRTRALLDACAAHVCSLCMCVRGCCPVLRRAAVEHGGDGAGGRHAATARRQLRVRVGSARRDRVTDKTWYQAWELCMHRCGCSPEPAPLHLRLRLRSPSLN